jgi:putative Ca2+/H+ antiporter (TMEM165/GDT1 family)
MELYPFFIAFIMIFISELGDKTQLIILSFSGSVKAKKILLGIALGSFFSHGLAVICGVSLTNIENPYITNLIKNITYFSFILLGVISLIPKKEKLSNSKSGIENSKNSLMNKILNLPFSYTFIIALSIFIGEFGDKTFLSSIGFGIEYPNYKLSLILGAVLGMIASDSLAIISGKFLSTYISEQKMKKISGLLFIIFGILGFIFH